MSRVKKEIDFDEFEKLCGLQCTEEEIAAWFNCSVDTIERRVKEEYGLTFREVFQSRRKLGHISLRRSQWKVANSGNPTMLIWLGKQYLNQIEKRDPSELEHLERTFALAYARKGPPEQK